MELNAQKWTHWEYWGFQGAEPTNMDGFNQQMGSSWVIGGQWKVIENARKPFKELRFDQDVFNGTSLT